MAIGTFTSIATLIHPMKTAEQFAVIDNSGRGGYTPPCHAGSTTATGMQFGIPREHLLGRFQEAIKVWQLAFKPERFDFMGKYWTVEDGLLAPQPYQEGGWPIWGGGNAVDAAIRRSADYGECWTCDPFPLMKEVWEHQTGIYKQRAEELGKKPYIVLMRDGWVADTFEDAAQRVRDPLHRAR